MLRLEVRRQETARPNSFSLWSQGRKGSCRPSTITARNDRITYSNSRLQLKLVISLSLNFLMAEMSMRIRSRKKLRPENNGDVAGEGSGDKEDP